MSQTPRAQGVYQTAQVVGPFVMTAGMTPRRDGVMIHQGQVGDAVTIPEAQEAAELAAANAVAAIRDVGIDLEQLHVARMTVYVNAAIGFVEHSLVADRASQYLMDVFGAERGCPVRAAVGVSSLPGNACVELDLTGWLHTR